MFTIPNDIGEAKSRLTKLGALVTAQQWERAAVVWAFTSKRGARNAVNGISFKQFAALGIAGLTKEHTVSFYHRRWQWAMDNLGVPATAPGVKVPDVTESWADDLDEQTPVEPEPEPEPAPPRAERREPPVPPRREPPEPPRRNPKPRQNPPRPQSRQQPPPKPVPTPDPEAASAARVMDDAVRAARLRAENPNSTLDDFAASAGFTTRNARRLVPLGRLPSTVREFISSEELSMRAAELLSTIDLTDDEKVGIAVKIIDGNAPSDRAEISDMLHTFELWDGDAKRSFLTDANQTFDQAKALRAERDRALRERKKLAADLRKKANAMPRHAYAPAMLTRMRELSTALLDLQENFDLLTPDFRSGILDLVEEIGTVSHALLASHGRTDTPDGTSKPTFTVIDGDLVG